MRGLPEQGVPFHSAQERIDLDTTSVRLMFNIMASFGEYELDVRREYWAETEARDEAARCAPGALSRQVPVPLDHGLVPAQLEALEVIEGVAAMAREADHVAAVLRERGVALRTCRLAAGVLRPDL
jgi:hypothetical protein